ncbi:MAG: archaeal proteasome endopeptidase complex subunit alpha [Candidatus Helarchaeota archaeon]
MFDVGRLGGYDRIATMFSPDGRIHQIEYAREAVKRGSLVLAARSNAGVVVLSQYNSFNPLYENNEKIFQIEEFIFTAFSGLLADSRVLINQARIEAQVQRLYYNEDPDLDVLAWKISNKMQQVTQFGGRPFGVSLIFAGIDSSGPSIHLIEPSGAKFKVKAIAVGNDENKAMSLLKEAYHEDATLDELKEMLMNILNEIDDENAPRELLTMDAKKKEVYKKLIESK